MASYCRLTGSLSLLAAGLLLVGAIPVLADQLCKPANPLPQSKCQKDAQCCSGLVCAQSGGVERCQPGCRVGGTFYPTGAANPANPCQLCQPSVTTTAFTNNVDGTTCNDGDACTRTDACHGGSCVGINLVLCTASDQCHDVGICNPATDQCSNPDRATGSTCDDGDACSFGDQCVLGVCNGSAHAICTALDACHDVGTCDPVTGQCSNPAKAAGSTCDDGDVATPTDTCTDGVCVQCVPSPDASPRYVVNSDQTITDRQTCLVWEMKNGADGVADAPNLHDVDNQYTWCTVTGDTTLDCSGNTRNWIADVNAENGTGFAGHNDWRVPTLAGCLSCWSYGACSPCSPHGLDTILLAQVPCGSSPCIDPIFGPTGAGYYWSSSSDVASIIDQHLPWFVDFSNGNIFNYASGTVPLGYARAVRGGP